ncbi:hypothetical protein SAMN05443575_2175 [Jatrophihabitans endophyticus]|uniref:Uncharacterized protein n=2 Tax=Jatrophihabitans endophyticus TaxID=1206085 RepID=A0A1M5KJN2_9ACTN|nr:hypothetical protein SAMN05443575_2175 [Jatrophihabitans endophyticus]
MSGYSPGMSEERTGGTDSTADTGYNDDTGKADPQVSPNKPGDDPREDVPDEKSRVPR